MGIFSKYDIVWVNNEIKEQKKLILEYKKLINLPLEEDLSLSKELKKHKKELKRLKYIKGSILYKEKIKEAQELLNSHKCDDFFPFLRLNSQGKVSLYAWFNCDASRDVLISFRQLVETFNYPPNLIKKVKMIVYDNDYAKSLFPLSLRFEIIKRDNYRCQICGRTAQDDNVKLEIDHKIPRAKGGTNRKSNLWTLCFDCNRGKRDKDL